MLYRMPKYREFFLNIAWQECCFRCKQIVGRKTDNETILLDVFYAEAGIDDG